ncbi:hypothetical protein FXO38_21215 [Capsicum annuum]|nr:hypothetical protein FXO38_21215 [Capsicum annuum]
MMQKKDVTKVIERTELFDFLVDAVHKDEIRKEGVGFGPSMLGSTSSDIQNTYPPMGQTSPSEVMIRGISVLKSERYKKAMRARLIEAKSVKRIVAVHSKTLQNCSEETSDSAELTLQVLSISFSQAREKTVKVISKKQQIIVTRGARLIG